MLATKAETWRGAGRVAGEEKAEWRTSTLLAASLNKICFVQCRRRWKVTKDSMTSYWMMSPHIRRVDGDDSPPMSLCLHCRRNYLYPAFRQGNTRFLMWLMNKWWGSQMEKGRGCEKKKGRAKKNALKVLMFKRWLCRQQSTFWILHQQ